MFSGFESRRALHGTDAVSGEHLVDVAQVHLLDYLHSVSDSRSKDEFKLSDLRASWKHAHSYAQSLETVDYNRADFSELSRRVRAVYIASLLKDGAGSLYSEEESVIAFHNRLAGILETQASCLFPFVSPHFKSIPKLLESFASLPESSIGIAFTCGTGQFYVTYHAILSLRKIFSLHTPIEVFYAGDSDLHPSMVKAFNLLENVKAINLLTYFPTEATEFSSWSLKPFVILASSYRTVLFMDSDILFFNNPLNVLESKLFKKTGQLYYHDRTNNEQKFVPGTEWFRSLLVEPSKSAASLRYLTGRTSHEMDSGFIALDKSRPGNLFSLLLACRMNSKIEREQTLYKYTYGDKESFWFANELLRVPFSFSPHFGSVLGTLNKERSQNGFQVVCGVWLLQLDESGVPFWWNGGGVLRDRGATPQKGFEFLEFEKMAFDLDIPGKRIANQWSPGHCFNQTEEYVRDLSNEEKTLLQRYKELYVTSVKEVVLE
ncbi:mannosyltransferase putative-domain-containing protein [Obelidium mucronatum]|nr:mannosyltransferase putative-domain-containing protein [Obelidium mucronatum]